MGLAVGFAVGEVTGADVVGLVGLAVGLWLGDTVGPAVGLIVGGVTGADVVGAVGFSVGP